MRVRLVLTAAAVATAAVLPAAPASAYCVPVVSWALRDCTDACDLAERVGVRPPADCLQ
jgi:hypothetical protein